MSEVIKRLRKERGLKAYELAERAKVSAAFLSKIENEKSGMSSAVARRIAEALGVDPGVVMFPESADKPASEAA